jgi:GNAT superfamily N-acetyltransferase
LLCHYGEGSGLATLLAAIDEERFWANVRTEFEETFRRFYRPERCVRMRRMYLEQPVAAIGEAVQLFPSDRSEIEELLAQGEWVMFLPACLAAGHYYGVRQKGRLIAVACTHIASPCYNLAALGSVFTHPDHRGKGLARISSSHTPASVRRAGISRVVLNVEEQKRAARHVYQRLGFQTACTCLDGECTRIQVKAVANDERTA